MAGRGQGRKVGRSLARGSTPPPRDTSSRAGVRAEGWAGEGEPWGLTGTTFGGVPIYLPVVPRGGGRYRCEEEKQGYHVQQTASRYLVFP